MDPVLLFFIGVAGFILFRLFSVLGTRTGHEARPDFDATRAPSNVSGERPTADLHEVVEDEETPPKPVSTNARILREADPNFDEPAFLEGARGAYEMIVEAFAAGDVRSIRPYLGDSVYEAFKQAVVDREASGQKADVKFVGIEHAGLVEADVNDDWVSAVTEFTSNQVRVTRDAEGNVVDGDPNRIDLVKDRWTFARKRGSQDPNWMLVATGGA
ncbi:MAG: Tim44/TimA family putative adaptor protein [Pseudomonadota bacterium]